MTKVYFIRHARPDFSVHDDYSRPLTEEGMKSCKFVTEFLSDKNITKVFSSPYKRTIDTVKDFAEGVGLDIEIVEDFRERKIDNVWIEDFTAFAKAQWNNFDYKLENGESLNEVQKRNVDVLNIILKKNKNANIVIGTHGTALSTILQYYNKNFDYNQFERIRNYMPFGVCIEFDEAEIVDIKEFVF